MKNVHPSSKGFDLPEIFQHISKGTAFTFKGNTLCFLFVHILTIALQVVCECLQASSIQTTFTISPSDSKQLPATVFRKDRWLLEVTGLSLSLYDLGLRLILFWGWFFHMLMLLFETYNVRHSLGKLQNCLIIHVVSFTLLRFPIFHNILKLSLCNIH